jgi:protein-S-isoprenylcysteine O-methyltransferase Ste14
MAMKITLADLVQIPWLVFGIYWLIAGLRAKRAQKAEAPGQQLAQILMMAAAFILLYSSDLRSGPLNERFIPEREWSDRLGVAFTWTGVAFAIWARFHIGKYWSARVTIVADHRLIRTGPYARIRHPIYTGILLALLGTALVIGEYRALVAVGIAVFAFARKAKREESFLASEFGAEFEEHRRLTGFFLPRFS